MEFVIYALLGILQGATEPIPVSSSGHLVIAQHLFGVRTPGLVFEVLVNFASLLAVLIIYRKDIVELIAGTWGYITTRDRRYAPSFRFVALLVLATIPAGVIGALFSDVIAAAFKGMTAIGVTLLLTGVALWLIRNLKGRKLDKDLTVKEAIVVGLAQALALIPGISRSGATIVAAMGMGMRQETALKFSFLLYIPVSVGGMVLEGAELLASPLPMQTLIAYAIAFIASFIASYYALRWFQGIMARGNLIYFSIYCFLAGSLVLIFLA